MTTSPCKSCAFTDPECWVADQAMLSKIQACLVPGHTPFFCHKGLEVVNGTYQTPRRPDGSEAIEALPPCIGFQRFQRQHQGKSLLAQQYEVFRVQHRMCKRFLKMPLPLAETCRQRGYNASLLAEALNLMALQRFPELERNTPHPAKEPTP